MNFSERNNMHHEINSNLDFLLLMEDYQQSYTKEFQKDPHLSSKAYSVCSNELSSKSIYYGDAYIKALTAEGLDVHQIFPFCQPLQYKWAKENGVRTLPLWAMKGPFQSYYYRKYKTNPLKYTLESIVTEQIKKYTPEYVWVFSGVPISKQTLKSWHSYAKHLILWWACPINRGFPYEEFDLILSGIPTLSEYFKARGINAAHMPHSFDPRILKNIPESQEKIMKVAFVGSLSEEHIERILLLEKLARNVEIDYYGNDVDFLPKDSPLRKSHKGSAWGKDLYSIYRKYLLVIHKNISVAGKTTSAKRLFEATGMGACVVAEESSDERELFKPNEEIVTYSNDDECIEKIKYLLENPKKAIEIGKMAQKRTLSDHTYARRIKELMDHISSNGMS
jgi:glycosyltransferase involved in cell wall biosynthesis